MAGCCVRTAVSCMTDSYADEMPYDVPANPDDDDEDTDGGSSASQKTKRG